MEEKLDKKKIRDLIRSKISELEGKVNELEELTKPIAPDVAIGRVSRMDAINNKSVNEASLRQARAKLHGLQHALDQIDKPSFGKCTRCGSIIPVGRLLVMPESTKCTRCSSF